ncbi:MAG: glycosyltransferase family 2 protein [Bacteroidetes bacterium]|nr:glycosyltransferase family 2 protein [Bacteroidota bacterium]
MTPLVSIILPTYNGERYLAQSIESCLAQTFLHWELILVDDCSTDHTPEIIGHYQDRDARIRSIRNERNLKLPLSLNAGSERAVGKYLTWTSDDNRYAPEAIQTLFDALESDAAIGLVYTDYTLINESGNQVGSKHFGDIRDSRVTWKGCGACFLYRAEIHHQLKGYDPSAFLIEDYDFFLRASLITSFVYLPRTDLYFYRYHPGSLTSLYGFYNLDLQKIVIERQLPRLLEQSTDADRARWLRKFAVYYGAQKGNASRMLHYLVLLCRASIGQGLLTTLYIPLKRIQISFFIYTRLLLALFRGLFSNWNASNE